MNMLIKFSLIAITVLLLASCVSYESEESGITSSWSKGLGLIAIDHYNQKK